VPSFDPKRVVDGQRKITVYKQLPTTSAGRKFELRNKVVGVYDKGKASVVETEQTIVDKESGEVYASVVGSAFYVGQGGWGGPKGEHLTPPGESFHLERMRLTTIVIYVAGPATPNYPPPKDRKPDAVREIQTTAETAQLYR
jgi:hypothetical protein